MVRVLALPWIGTSRLVKYLLGECPPDWALSLLLHQGAKSQGCRKNVSFCAGVADKPEKRRREKKQPHTHKQSQVIFAQIKLRWNALEI